MNERVPRELLFGNPEKASPKISPNGKLWAYLAPDEGVLNIWVGPEGGPAKPLTRDRGRGIRVFLWAEDERSILYLQDLNGDENWHLYQADLETSVARDLTPYPGVQAQIVATEPGFPDEILVALNDRDPKLHDVWRLNLKTGERALEATNPGDAIGWLPDRDFKIGLHKAAAPDGGTILRVRDGAGWRDFLTCGPDDQLGAHGFSPDGQNIYIESSVDRDTTALFEAPLAGGPGKIIAEHPESDLGAVLLHPRDHAVEAAAFELDRRAWRVLDPKLEADFAALSALDGDVSIVSRDDADAVWYVLVDRPDRSPAFLRWDRLKRAASPLFAARPRLAPYTLAPMTPVQYAARDGLTVRGYLTTPNGAAAEKLPLVVLVHGGPWVRDRWGFHPEAQWLASLGCAALQLNYRGSSGFGKRHLHAGDREWGAKMQDDLTDGVRWAVARGIADPARVAIYGGSYGGYAALAGAAFTPGVYRCAIDVVGPSNLVTLIKSIPPYWEPMKRVFDLRVGSIEREEEFLKSRSPLFHVDKIDIPLLIAQGAHDPRVKQAEAEQIVAALRAKGKPVAYLLYPDEGHGFAKPSNRLDFYAKAEAFLAEHLSLAPAIVE
ncbi:MAG: S9 family peptidase [Elusimicrobia bacterium]|nr:S9 family peptidase [Elusimicrobiota bacterium]